mmetsp:Transcript_3477/g.9071  ORF Transcript_3477/g.9071 Transcript_3477/m.9071 type:complete len:453 (+) Transcript_3477:56-1414(+)
MLLRGSPLSAIARLLPFLLSSHRSSRWCEDRFLPKVSGGVVIHLPLLGQVLGPQGLDKAQAEPAHEVQDGLVPSPCHQLLHHHAPVQVLPRTRLLLPLRLRLGDAHLQARARLAALRGGLDQQAHSLLRRLAVRHEQHFKNVFRTDLGAVDREGRPHVRQQGLLPRLRHLSPAVEAERHGRLVCPLQLRGGKPFKVVRVAIVTAVTAGPKRVRCQLQPLVNLQRDADLLGEVPLHLVNLLGRDLVAVYAKQDDVVRPVALEFGRESPAVAAGDDPEAEVVRLAAAPHAVVPLAAQIEVAVLALLVALVVLEEQLDDNRVLTDFRSQFLREIPLGLSGVAEAKQLALLAQHLAVVVGGALPGESLHKLLLLRPGFLRRRTGSGSCRGGCGGGAIGSLPAAAGLEGGQERDQVRGNVPHEDHLVHVRIAVRIDAPRQLLSERGPCQHERGLRRA